MSERKRILIVGGVAGGASAAARARRLSEDAEIVIFERGNDVSFANCGLPYHIGGAIPDRDRLLVQTPEGLWKRYRIDVRVRHEVLSVDPQKKQIVVRNLTAGEDSVEPYDALILSPGAEPIRPPIPGADSDGVFTLRSLADMDRIKHVVEEKQPVRAVVVGGGYIGLEMTEALRERGLEVTLVELAPQVFSPADIEMVAPVHDELDRQGVELLLGTSMTSISQEDGTLHARLSTGDDIKCGMVILAIGVKPEVKLARDAGLEIGESGGIAVDDHMRTSDPGIYAVGDAVEVTHTVSGGKVAIPLAGPANRQGRIAADNILGRDSAYRGSQGTAICKVFDLAVALTGLNERQLKQSGRSYEKVYVHPANHAGYYPGASQISLKLLFDPEDGAILGGQAVGVDSVDKRIDVLATAMRAGMTVEDLEHLELCYAPPYGSAKDPVNYAGFVAANFMRGDMPLCHVEDVVDPEDDQVLLDVRTYSEVEAGTIPGAQNIPVDELRDRLGELPSDKEILAFCQVGLRGYVAARTLMQNGFRVRNLTGGYKTYRNAVGLRTDLGPDAGEMTDDTGETQPAVALPKDDPEVDVVRMVDAKGLQCPGPILRLKEELAALNDGQALTIAVTEPGFPTDVAAWCHSTGHRLLALHTDNGTSSATVQKNGADASLIAGRGKGSCEPKKKSMVVFSGDLDKALASFIIANGAAAMGSDVTMFFTFWGLNVLRKPERVKVRKGLVERMFGWMMPRGADRLQLSKMNMAGLGAQMIKGIMRRKHVPSLPDLIAKARDAGVRLVACSMSMDLMGIKREELIEGVEEAGVASYLDTAEAGTVNLFI
jgi:NADPH-dependent 2,4-dienoyl-CoA reductase/sulfur reductase-like enzyme/peroxiredoxin family protein/rhodanese-related sulfurtransferase/TusA-related sulfurtransferase